MSQQDATPQPPPPNFALEGIALEVKSAQRTHKFLCDVFAQSNTLFSWDPLIQQKGELPKLTPDGMHTDFRMCNTAIRFSTATSSQNSVAVHKIDFKVHVKDVDHVKEVLDNHKWNYKLGREEAPGHPKWIEFRDLDGYNWHVSEVRKY